VLIDRFLPEFEARERHAVPVRAPADRAYIAARRVDLARSAAIRALFAARGIPMLLRRGARRPRTMALDDLLRGGFVMLGEEPPVEFVLGVAGRFWTPGGGIARIGPEDFGPFDQPGHAKAAWNFRIEPRGADRSIVYTETRIHCTDDAARRRFLLYWSVVGPFSAVIRRQALSLVARDAEGRE